MQQFKYFSSVEGHIVTRFISLRSPVAQYIGAKRIGKKITWNTKEVVAIPLQEFTKYRREFRRALRDGSLKERTEAEFKVWQAERTKEDEEAKAKADKAKADANAAKVEAGGSGQEAPAAPEGNQGGGQEEASTNQGNDSAEGTPDATTEQQGGTKPSGSARTSKKSRRS